MTLSDLEDPSELARCARSDCSRYRLNDHTPLCAQHMRDQETSSAGYVEPELEARVATVRTEDDDHPGQKKVYDKETGEASWVDDPDWRPTPRPEPTTPESRLYVGPDPDTAHPDNPEQPFSSRPGAPQRAERQPTDTGCWIVHHPDWTTLTLFNDEIQALRHAVANSMTVTWATWGQQCGSQQSPVSEDASPRPVPPLPSASGTSWPLTDPPVGN